MNHTAEIISVGTELLLGNVTNTDARDISEMLSELGINVYYHTVVGDNPKRLRLAVEIARRRADIIITTGGLGPTFDDLTKQTLAECFSRKLIFDEETAETIRSYFKRRGRGVEMTDNNYQQAYLPENCTPFHNQWGTAPGCAFKEGDTHVLMLPGPPNECVPMFRHCAMPYLMQLSDSLICSHNIHVFGLGESAMEAKLRPLMLELTNPTLAPYAKSGECLLRVTAKASSEKEADALMAPVIEKVRETLGDVIYSVDVDSLEETVCRLLTAQHKTLATAESCTGGLVGKRLTDVPGASAVYRGGAVTYATDTKADLLGVDEDLLNEKGPVCREVAMQMAMGVRARFGADVGVGITGVAGPSPDDRGNPVGLVYVALSVSSGVFCRELRLGSGRERIRTSAASHAFDMIRRYLTGLDVENIKI